MSSEETVTGEEHKALLRWHQTQHMTACLKEIDDEEQEDLKGWFKFKIKTLAIAMTSCDTANCRFITTTYEFSFQTHFGVLNPPFQSKSVV